jgi:excinuclease UvrABC helicase subunit UvrB
MQVKIQPSVIKALNKEIQLLIPQCKTLSQTEKLIAELEKQMNLLRDHGNTLYEIHQEQIREQLRLIESQMPDRLKHLLDKGLISQAEYSFMEPRLCDDVPF